MSRRGAGQGEGDGQSPPRENGSPRLLLYRKSPSVRKSRCGAGMAPAIAGAKLSPKLFFVTRGAGRSQGPDPRDSGALFSCQGYMPRSR